MLNSIIILSIIFSSSSQILLKKGAMQLELEELNNITDVFTLLVSVVTNIYVVFGILFQVVALGIWLYVLKRVEVSYAYPFIALGFIFVMALSYCLFNERLDVFKVVGGLTICVGIFILSLSKQGA